MHRRLRSPWGRKTQNPGCQRGSPARINFGNNYAEQSAGPAHALRFSRANGGTVLGNAYSYSSIIARRTDFLYGFGTGWFAKCDLVIKGCDGGIAAWNGTNTMYGNKFGVYAHDAVIRAANSSVAAEKEGECALGRPWNSGHRSIFANTYQYKTIRDSGYVLWQVPVMEQSLTAEYRNYGPGFDVEARREYNYSVLLDRDGFEPYSSPMKVFLTEEGKPEDIRWIDTRFRQ